MPEVVFKGAGSFMFSGKFLDELLGNAYLEKKCQTAEKALNLIGNETHLNPAAKG